MQRGFSLIEMVVAVGIFSLIVVVFSGTFVSAIQIQRVILAKRQLLEETSFAMEYMARSLRMAQKDTAVSCLSAAGLNYEKTQAGLGIKFINSQGACQEFYLDTNTSQLMENKDGVVLPLTSDNIKAVSFLIGPDASWDQNDDLQPKITLNLLVESQKATLKKQSTLRVQTAISQRNLDILK